MQLLFFQILVLPYYMCAFFLIKIHGILVAPVLHSYSLILSTKGDLLNWNLNVWDLNTDALRYCLKTMDILHMSN